MSSISFREFSGTAAENYQRFFVPAIAERTAVDLLSAAALQPGERVVDVACGTGLIARLAAAQIGASGSVMGVDVAPEMIDVAAAQPSAEEPTIDWRVGDAAALPLPDQSCDAVLCQMGLMFLEDRVGALGEMRRVLAPGGRLIANTPGRIPPPFEFMAQALADHIDPALGEFVQVVFSLHDPDAVAELFNEAGLVDVSVVESTTTITLPPPADFLWQYLSFTPIGPVVAQAPESEQAALERDVVESWQPYVADGSTQYDQSMVLVVARSAP